MDFCTSCGKPLAEGAAFCASCGTPRPQVDAPAAPAPAAPSSIDDAAAPVASGDAAEDKKSQKALLLSSGALVVVAAIVVGLLFVFGVFKNDKAAGDPQAAVADLMSSVVSLEPTKALSAIAPGEVSGFSSLVEAAKGPGPKAAVEKLKSQFAAMQSSSGSSMLPPQARMVMAMLSGISATDISNTFKAVSVKFTNMKYATTSLGTDISNVTINGGDITVALDKSKLPAQIKSLLDMAMASGSANLPAWANDIVTGTGHTWHIQDFLGDVTGHGQKLDAIVVKQDGGWYVSLFGTIAQHVYEAETYKRAQSGGSALPSPDWSLYANPPKAITAATPNDVPGNLVKAFNDRSMMEIFQNLPQNEVRALFPYVPLLQAAADKGGASSTTLSVSGVSSTTTKTDGNQVRVLYTQGTASSAKDGQTQTVSVNNGCYSNGGSQQCVSTWPQFAQTLAGVFGIDKGVPITLQKVDTGYQLDPVASVVGPLADALANAGKLADAVTQAITYFQQKMQAAMSSYGSSSSGCVDSSGNVTC